MGIFPSDYYNNNGYATVETEKSTPKLLKEYALNFETGEPQIDQNGKFIIVEGLEAVKVRCYLALNIQRGKYFIYPNIGNNLKKLTGKNLAYFNKEIQGILEEALKDDYVTGIQNINVTQEANKITVEFIVNTIYGDYIDHITE